MSNRTDFETLMNAGNLQVRFIRLRENKLFETFVIGILDWGITFFFLLEILVRLVAEGSIRRFFSKGWNVFDFVIVVETLQREHERFSVDEGEAAMDTYRSAVRKCTVFEADTSRSSWPSDMARLEEEVRRPPPEIRLPAMATAGPESAALRVRVGRRGLQQRAALPAGERHGVQAVVDGYRESASCWRSSSSWRVRDRAEAGDW